MQYEATLNILWAVLGVCALASTARIALRDNEARQVPRWLLIVFLVATALFPYISASDDILRLDYAQGIHTGAPAPSQISSTDSQGPPHQQSGDLLRLYESLDTPLACRLVTLVFAVMLIAFVGAWSRSCVSRTVPDTPGRSPPIRAF